MYRILYFVILISVKIFGQINQQNYGPYASEFLKFEMCKGPKRGECGTIRYNNIRNMSDIPFSGDIPKDCPLKHVKITIGTLQNSNRTTKLWNYQPSKPCDHFVLGPFLMKTFNINKNCNVKKGYYEMHVNMNELGRKFLGSSFFYDTYFFKIMAYNDVNNFFCVQTAVKISKP